jgi:hypothetical protein
VKPNPAISFQQVEEAIGNDRIQLEKEDLETDYLSTLKESDNVEQILLQTEAAFFGNE